MAEKLSAERATGNLTRPTFLEFVEKHEAVDDEIADAQETMRSIRRRRKDLRATITAAGIVIHEFDRHLVDEKRSGDEREAAEHAYRQYMAWRGKPTGFQGKPDLTADSPGDALAFEQREVKRADRDGFKAGKAGKRADVNPWRPGSEPFAAFHSSWLRGQAEKVTTEIKAPDQPARRGRPRSPERLARDAAAATGNGADPDPALPLGTVTFDTPPANGEAGAMPDAEAAPDAAARALGKEDGLAGHRGHAARYAAGEAGHGYYELGHGEGERERHAVVLAERPGFDNPADHNDPGLDAQPETVGLPLQPGEIG